MAVSYKLRLELFTLRCAPVCIFTQPQANAPQLFCAIKKYSKAEHNSSNKQLYATPVYPATHNLQHSKTNKNHITLTLINATHAILFNSPKSR